MATIVKHLGPMLPRVARDVATGVGLVAAESDRALLRFQALGAFSSHGLKYFNRRDTCVADDASSEAEFQESRERKGAMDSHAGSSIQKTEQQSEISGGGAVVPQQQQPEELFTPKKAEESREERPFVSLEADAHVQPLSQTVSLPSVDAHLPPQ